MSTQLKIENVADSDIDNSKKTLVASLELALVKYLDSDDGGILDSTADTRYEKSVFRAHTHPALPKGKPSLTCRSFHSSTGLESSL